MIGYSYSEATGDITNIGRDGLLAAYRKISRCRLAKHLRITPQAISQWRRIPAERVIDVERVTGVSREQLRPDLYPPSIRAANE